MKRLGVRNVLEHPPWRALTRHHYLFLTLSTTTSILRMKLTNFVIFVVLFIMQNTRLSKPDATTALNDAMTKNAKQFFAESASARNDFVKQTRDQTLKILLNNANMKDLGPNVISDKFIAEELNCSRRAVRTYRNNTTPFKDFQPAAKSKGLGKNHFIYKHNDLAQLIVKHWIEESTPSPNKKDVVHKHSDRPGDHSRVTPGEGKANFIKCNVKGRCKSDQRR